MGLCLGKCGCGACNATFCVSGCGTSFDGATVTITGGASGVTGPTGCVVLAIGAAGTHTITVTAAGFTTTIATRSISCGGTVNISMTQPANTVCCTGCPVPETLSLTDSNGTIALIYNGVVWAGNYTLSVATTKVASSFGSCICAAEASGSLYVQYSLTCLSTGMELTLCWNVTNYTPVPGVCGGLPCGSYTYLDAGSSGVTPVPCVTPECAPGGGVVCAIGGIFVSDTEPISNCGTFSWNSTSMGGGILNPTSGSVTISP